MLDVRGIGVRFRAEHKVLLFKGSSSALGPNKCLIQLILVTAFTTISSQREQIVVDPVNQYQKL